VSKKRTRIFIRGLGNLEIMEVYPASPSDFTSVGYLKNTQVQIDPEMLNVVQETGDLVTQVVSAKSVSVLSNLLQAEKTNIDLIRDSEDKIFTVRYHGRAHHSGIYQYYCFERAKITPKMGLTFGNAERLLPLLITSIYQEDYAGAYNVPLVYLWEGEYDVDPSYCKLWLDAKLGLNTDTLYALDISGFARHGILNIAGLWQTGTPSRFWRFDGTDDNINLGDVFDDDGTSDKLVAVWVRIQGANASTQEIFGKKASLGNAAGFAVYRYTDNTVRFQIGDGDSNAEVVTVATLLQNVWSLIAVTIDRNGNMQMYKDGAVTGAAVSVASQTTGTNAANFLLGAVGAAFGQVDISGIHCKDYGAGGLPSNAATIIANMYTAEKTAHGLT